MEYPILLLDLETTGTNTQEDRIVEIAIVKYTEAGKAPIIKRTLINPEIPIPAAVTEIHGITDDMVKEAPKFRQLAKSLLEFMGTTDLAGYNLLHFDLPMPGRGKQRGTETYKKIQMTHGSLFSGIGGFDFAAQSMGWQNKFHCEWTPFCQTVLKHYWPEAETFTDITKSDFKKYESTIDVLTGGFPCQPYSAAGLRKGSDDERHLWPEMLRAIREIQPRYVVGENVRGLTNWNAGVVFDEVQADLESAGYEVLPFLLPAAAVNAPHRRDRIWFVAHANTSRSGTRNDPAGWKEGANLIGSSKRSTMENIANAHSFGLRTENNREGESKRTSEDGPEQHATHATNQGLSIAGPEPEQQETNEGQRVKHSSRENDATNADRAGLEQGHEKMEGRPSEQPDSVRIQRDDTDTSHQGLQRGSLAGSNTGPGQEPFNQQFNGSFRSSWENFPSQSPIRCGNDGIPTGLVGVTVSKHRVESIKGYGNAIVPQVAMQIFKAIEAYEKTK